MEFTVPLERPQLILTRPAVNEIYYSDGIRCWRHASAALDDDDAGRTYATWDELLSPEKNEHRRVERSFKPTIEALAARERLYHGVLPRITAVLLSADAKKRLYDDHAKNRALLDAKAVRAIEAAAAWSEFAKSVTAAIVNERGVRSRQLDDTLDDDMVRQTSEQSDIAHIVWTYLEPVIPPGTQLVTYPARQYGN
jgi:hypothetical protein